MKYHFTSQVRFSLIALFLALLAILLSALPASAQEGPGLILNDVSAEPVAGELAYQVTAYLTVTGVDGEPLAGLGAADFSAAQDGEAVALESAEGAERPQSIVLALDTSGSMAFQGKIDAVREAASDFVGGLGAADQVALVAFDDDAEIEMLPSGDLGSALNLVGGLSARPDSGTCLYDAAYTAVEVASTAPPGQRAVLLLTDGIDELPDQSGPCSQHSADEVIALANALTTRAPVYTIGVGTRIDARELTRIADATGGAALIAPEPGDVAGLFAAVSAQLKNQYRLVYQTQTTSGEHNLAVTVEAGGGTAVASRTFFAPELPPMLSLTGLDDGAILDGEGVVRATVGGGGELVRAAFSLDGAPLSEDDQSPFEARLDAADLEPGSHTLDVQAQLADGSTLAAALTFEVVGTVEEPVEAGPPEVEPPALDQAEAPVESGRRMGWMLPVALAVLIVAGAVILIGRRRARDATPLPDSPAPPPVEPPLPAVPESPTAAAEPESPPVSTGPVFGRLRVEKGLLLAQGQEFELRGTGARLGRGQNNQVVLPESSVAREHAEVRTLPDGTFWIVDLGTRSGTFVNGVEVEREGAPLADGDTIQLGSRTILRFFAA
jgi:Mg-chelatase subunit ChlD